VVKVKNMLERKESQAAGSLARRMLEYLGIKRAYVQSISTQEEDAVRVNIPLDYTDWKPVEVAFIEAESQKARALEQMRRQQFI
jgi:hypothetical protein